ncbi:MAG: alpha/beta hydrolase [Bacteroidota bacterium]
MKKTAAILLICYSVAAFPQDERKAHVDSLLSGIRVQKDIRYNQTGRPLLLDMYFPGTKDDKALPCVVWIHGGGLTSEDIKKDYDLVRWGIARSVRRGTINVSVDYRLITESPLPAAIQDCETAIRFLKSHAAEYGIDTSKMAVVGESAGGYLAGFLVFAGNTNIFSTGDWNKASNSLSCGVLWYPAVNHPPYNMIDYISPDDIPVISVHGDNDHIVPIDRSCQIREKCKEKGVDFQLYAISGSGHGFFDDSSWEYNERYRADMEEAIGITLSFIGKHLGNKPEHISGTGVEPETIPEELAKQMIENQAFVKYSGGENFCWHAQVGLNKFVDYYKLTENTGWLDAGMAYYDFLIGKMATDPDGYRGWIGLYGYDRNYWADALVGDAILFKGILDFSVLVMENPSLEKKYGEKADSYVRTAEREFFEKWDQRGCWIDDGPFGTYTGFDKYLKPGNTDRWIHAPEVDRSGLSHPFNKQMAAGAVCLRLYRITGDERYRTRAEKIFFTAKSHFQYFDNHYCWNYFEPLYPGDVDLERKDTRHGVWVHAWRSGYQAEEVARIAEAYQYGIVFDAQDIQRIINTNLNVMWNKDTVNPEFINSNGLGADGDTSGIAAFQRVYGHSNVVKNGGELWTGLLDFDPTIRRLYERKFRDNRNSAEYLLYKKTVLKSPPGFERKLVRGEAVVPEFHFTESRELNLATVLPHRIQDGAGAIIICQAWTGGGLQIDLFTADDELECTLYTGEIHQGLFIMTWDGKDPASGRSCKGTYKIRWTMGSGYREFPVEVG